MDEKYSVNIVWGTLNPDGSWTPNPLLKMSSDEQYAQSREAILDHYKNVLNRNKDIVLDIITSRTSA